MGKKKGMKPLNNQAAIKFCSINKEHISYFKNTLLCQPNEICPGVHVMLTHNVHIVHLYSNLHNSHLFVLFLVKIFADRNTIDFSPKVCFLRSLSC